MIRKLSVVVRLAALFLLAAPALGSASPFSTIFLAGDSLSDQGNLFTSIASIAGPANAVPASDHYFNGRFSNGPVYADFLAQRLGLPLSPSFTGGNNFAYGGARTTYSSAEQGPLNGPFPPGTFPWTLNLEVQAFNARGVQDPDALYIVFSGSNDIGDLIAKLPISGFDPTMIPTLLNGIEGAVQAFAAAGARTVVVPNIPNLALTPLVQANGPAAIGAATFFSNLYNQQLQALLTTLDANLDLRIIQFQLDDFLNDIVSHPAAFGLTNVNTACYSGFVVANPAGTECPNPDEFVFWDRVHPTTVVHSLIANAIFAAVPEPSTLPLLLAGVLALGVLFRKSSRRD